MTHSAEKDALRRVTLRRRSDDREGPTFDVTGWSPREFDRLWDGLVMKVDFEVWCPHYDPERGDDQTIEDWLRPIPPGGGETE